MSAATKELYAKLMGILADGRKAAVLSVYAPDGAVTKRVLPQDDPAYAETLALADAEGAVTDGPVTHLREKDGVLTAVEHYLPRPRLIILGGGHIALALTQMAKACDFYTLVFDDRPMFANAARFPAADFVICDDFSRLFERVDIREGDYVVIVTRGHKHDKECLKGVLKGRPPAYTGMIGSRRRVAIVMRQLAEEGHPESRLAGVRSPIGLRIGAVTPAEISVSILAEIIQAKRAERAEADGNGSDLETAARLAKDGESADALITILETHGSVPRETGAKMSMSYEGAIIGTIGGGCAESGIMQDARALIREGGWRTATIDMTDTAEEDGMVCGGQMTVLIEKT
ncbi:MAG: XdhC family protein [Clostridiales Family XIII bacterium]|jgi:xanthine dehydrogenase accessory factor|nr:XdhC family protein [Clostridiales Family XIII bacterium]